MIRRDIKAEIGSKHDTTDADVSVVDTEVGAITAAVSVVDTEISTIDAEVG